MRQAFEKVRILDLTHVLAGPFAAYQLGLLGADVIKIERPDEPDQSRQSGPDLALNESGMGTAYQAQAWNKKTMSLDLKTAKGREILLALVSTADVLVENYRPGALEDLGLGAKDLIAANPRLIYCSMSAFGHTGPRREQTAYDIVIQGISGIMSMNGPQGSEPMRLGIPAIDYSTGMMASFAISAALFQRSVTNKGQHIDLAMFDVAKMLMAANISSYYKTSRNPVATGNRLHLATQGVFETKDTHLVVAANNFRQQRRLWTVLGHPERFRENVRERTINEEGDRALLQDILLQKSAQEWEDLLTKNRVPAARIRTLQEALSDPQSLERGAIHFPQDGNIPVALSAFTMDGQKPVAKTPPRACGADTALILSELGYSRSEISDLRTEGVI